MDGASILHYLTMIDCWLVIKLFIFLTGKGKTFSHLFNIYREEGLLTFQDICIKYATCLVLQLQKN